GLAFKRRRIARRAGEPRRDELLERTLVPGVRAMLVEDRRRTIDDGLRQDRFAALRAVERGDGHAPGALARDAPVGAVRNHVEDAVAAPRRDPLHLALN